MVSNGAGNLYVVATPIGNLEDLTPRARQVLGAVRLVAAEDTRHTGRLLARLGIDTRLVSLHEHNEQQRVPAILETLRDGHDVALVSDAGTPLVSDPGYRLLKAVREAGLRVSPVPGACAAIAALSIAGLPSDRFVFEGFLPDKAGPRRARLEAVAGETATLIYYVSVHKVTATLGDMVRVLGGERQATLARELTKTYETVWHGTLAELAARVAADDLRGEVVVVVAGATRTPETPASVDLESLLQALLGELPVARAAKLAARLTGVSRSTAYDTALRLSDKREA